MSACFYLKTRVCGAFLRIIHSLFNSWKHQRRWRFRKKVSVLKLNTAFWRWSIWKIDRWKRRLQKKKACHIVDSISVQVRLNLDNIREHVKMFEERISEDRWKKKAKTQLSKERFAKLNKPFQVLPGFSVLTKLSPHLVNRGKPSNSCSCLNTVTID